MAQTNKDANKQRRTLSRDEKAARVKAAQERAAREKAAHERRESMKKIFTIVVCVILVLALGIPTVALSFIGS